MKDRADAILRPAQAAFLDELLGDRDPLLAEMERDAAAGDVPVSDPEVGRLLEILARACGARRIVEVGTAIGYGTLCLARGAPDAEVMSIDLDPARLATARSYLERAGVADRVRLLQGAALDVLRTIDGPIDLAYLDAVKTEYRAYLDLLVPKLRPGGLVVADNLLGKGWVAEPTEESASDASTQAIRDFDRYLTTHPSLRALVLPLGDGVGVAVKA